MHQVVNFDVDSLPQALEHKFTGQTQKGVNNKIARVKVPVKDG